MEHMELVGKKWNKAGKLVSDSWLYAVVDTDKGGGMLVPVGGVLYEGLAYAEIGYNKARSELYPEGDPFKALQLYRLRPVKGFGDAVS